jgi:hypothetical protein
MTRDFIPAAMVAQLLDLPNAEAFLYRREALEDQGFPLPVSWSRRPLKWRTDQVAAWINRQGLPRAAEVVPLRVVGGNARLLHLAGSAR